MSGYVGYSKSVNAANAEVRGLLPLSKITGAPRWAIKIAAEIVGSLEWHHTSKMYNKTEYYEAALMVRVALDLARQYGTAKRAAAEIAAKRAARSRAAYMASPGKPKHRLDCQRWMQLPGMPEKICAGNREIIGHLRRLGMPINSNNVAWATAIEYNRRRKIWLREDVRRHIRALRYPSGLQNALAFLAA